MSDEKQEKSMTDQNPMRIAEEMRAKRAAATQGEWSRRHNGSGEWADRPEGWRNEILIEGDPEEPPVMVVSVDGHTSDEDTAFIAYAANNAIALADALDEERKHADRLEKALKIFHDEGCEIEACGYGMPCKVERLLAERRKP